ncbi:MAG: type VI secretion system tip protein TssI/VgrG [Polyangiaceae bacterium]
MPNFELSFPDRSDVFSVRHFRVEQRLSTPFSISIAARAERFDVDLDALTGSAIVFTLATGGGGSLSWRGICGQARILHAEPTGHSTYAFTILPVLGLLAHRSACRVFRRMTAPAIASAILREWGIEVTERLELAHPVLDFRVQYNESDLAFVSRTLEEAGITYFSASADEHAGVILSDRPEHGELRGAPIPFFGDTSTAGGRPFAASVMRGASVRARAARVRDYDFERPSFDLHSDASMGAASTGVDDSHRADLLEQGHYRPGASVGVAMGRTSGTAQASILAAVAQRRLDATRADSRTLTFETNVAEVEPGQLRAIEGHPRSELGDGARILIVATTLEGARDGGQHMRVDARFADLPHRPALTTRRPHVGGVQSATVVGPTGQEIHVDEHGRVRVLFPWDEEGARGDGSSCWVRVSQGWAGAGFGFIAHPRVGDEVLIAFLDGDPDQPVVVGRLHNATHPPPYRLPEERDTTGVRTSSTPGGGGYNELRFVDRAGVELVALRAQRDLTESVLANHTSDVGGDRSVTVARDRRVTVAGNDALLVAGERSVTAGELATHVGGNASRRVGGEWSDQVDGSSQSSVRGNRMEQTQGKALVSVNGDHRLVVAGHHGVLVGTDGAHSSSTLFVHGVHAATATGRYTVASDTAIKLKCGSSAIELTPEVVTIRAKKIVVAETDEAHFTGKGPALHLTKEAELSADKVKVLAEGAKLLLDTDAALHGASIALGSGASRSEDASRDSAVETRPFRVRVTDGSGHPYANKHYHLLVDGTLHEADTDGDGLVEQAIPTDAAVADMTVWIDRYPTGHRLHWLLELRDLPSASTARGAQLRLTNLGYYRGPICDDGGDLDEATRESLRRFQRARGIPVTGRLDDATVAALRDAHGA